MTLGTAPAFREAFKSPRCVDRPFVEGRWRHQARQFIAPSMSSADHFYYQHGRPTSPAQQPDTPKGNFQARERLLHLNFVLFDGAAARRISFREPICPSSG